MNRRPIIAAALALLLPVKPVFAWAMMPAQGPSYVVAVNAPFVLATHAAPPLLPVALIAIPVIEPDAAAPAIQQQRAIVASLLLETGCDQAEAQRQARQLTAEDLAVLAANPRMIQKAGEMDELTKNLIWALVIAGVVVAIVIAADGSISVN